MYNNYDYINSTKFVKLQHEFLSVFLCLLVVVPIMWLLYFENTNAQNIF